jgi:hypothetical protein
MLTIGCTGIKTLIWSMSRWLWLLGEAAKQLSRALPPISAANRDGTMVQQQ